VRRGKADRFGPGTRLVFRRTACAVPLSYSCNEIKDELKNAASGIVVHVELGDHNDEDRD